MSISVSESICIYICMYILPIARADTNRAAHTKPHRTYRGIVRLEAIPYIRLLCIYMYMYMYIYICMYIWPTAQAGTNRDAHKKRHRT